MATYTYQENQRGHVRLVISPGMTPSGKDRWGDKWVTRRVDTFEGGRLLKAVMACEGDQSRDYQLLKQEIEAVLGEVEG